MNVRRLFVVALCAFSAACLSDETAPSSCTYKLSNALSETYSCSVVVISDGHSTALAISATDGGGGVVVGTDIALTLSEGAAFEHQVYDPGNIVSGDILVAHGETDVWDASTNATDLQNHPNQGSFTLTVTSIGTPITAGGSTVWAHAQGTLTATLPRGHDGTATGEVEVEVSFTDSLSSVGGVTAASIGSGFGSGTGTGSGTGEDGGTDEDAGADAGGDSGGGGADDAGSDGGEGTGCTLTYTGAVELVSPCDVNASGSSSKASITITSSGDATGRDAASFSAGGATMEYSGALVAGVFDATGNTAGGSSEGELETGSGEWLEAFDSTSPSNATGTFRWDVTSAGTARMGPLGTTTYSGVHGSYTGTLADGSSSGSGVKLSIAF